MKFADVASHLKSMSLVTIVTAVIVIIVVVVTLVLMRVTGEAKMSISGVGISLTLFIGLFLIVGMQAAQLAMLNTSMRRELEECKRRTTSR